MKKLYLVLLSFFVFTSIYGQTQKKVLKTKQIIEQRSIYLNGGTRATFGGKSRTYIQIDLPVNTKNWYYSFTTSPGESGTQNLNLLIQLTSMVADPSGITTSALNNVQVPEGSQSIDVYLCDRKNIDKFLNKDDLYGGSYTYNMEGSVENTKQGIIEVDDITDGTYFLGLKNPSSLDGVNISIEVVAIIEETLEVELTDDQQKAILYGNLGWKQFQNKDYNKCIEYCNKANDLFEYGWIIANMGLAQLLLGLESEAMETYINAITLIKKQENPENVFSQIIGDINNVLIENPDLSGASDIKDILEMEYSTYKK
jgi:tetratricopeptide (TPR) repeat protein